MCPSIIYTTDPVRIIEGLEPIPADMGRDMCYTLDRLPYRDKKRFTPTFTLSGKKLHVFGLREGAEVAAENP